MLYLILSLITTTTSENHKTTRVQCYLWTTGANYNANLYAVSQM